MSTKKKHEIEIWGKKTKKARSPHPGVERTTWVYNGSSFKEKENGRKERLGIPALRTRGGGGGGNPLYNYWELGLVNNEISSIEIQKRSKGSQSPTQCGEGGERKRQFFFNFIGLKEAEGIR